MTVLSQEPLRKELAHRETSGLDVTLFWEAETERLTVWVCDHREGAYLEIPADADLALDVFYHPFAYRTSPPSTTKTSQSESRSDPSRHNTTAP